MPEKSANQLQTAPNIGAALKYNPHLWSSTELRAIFVARKKELQQIIKCISETKAKTVPQHILITGHRGMGKSTLLQRVALAVAEDSELSKTWLALRFPEEQYTVSTLEELWINVLGSLADTLDEKEELQHGIDAFLDKLEQLPKEDREKQALEYLQQWCDRHQRRLLLLMDSSDLLLTNLSHSASSKKANAGATQLWRLRNTLQNDSRFFWLGGSYQPLETEALYHDTFLDFFYNIELKPLTLKEMRATMRELARTFGLGRRLTGENAVAEITQGFEQHPERLKTLHRLTGGNLRTTVTLYELFSAGGENQVQTDLKRLLDLMTPLYKHRLESLADQPRKILAHLFEHWAPISLAELASLSGLKKPSLSPQLIRLEQEGLIEKTQLPATTRKGYQVTERFFNIWYLMRNAPRKLRMRLGYLVQFMGLWYSSNELTQLAIQQQQKHKNSQSLGLADYEYSRALAATLSEQNAVKHKLEWTVFRQMWGELQQQLPSLFDLQGNDKPFATSAEYLKRLEAISEKLLLCSLGISGQQLSLWASRVMGAISLSLEEKERIAETALGDSQFKFNELNKAFIEETENFSRQYGKKSCEIVQTAIQQGDFFPDCPDSELAYSQLVNCFSVNINAFIFALSLFELKHHDEFVEKAYKYLISLNSKNAYPFAGLGYLLHYHLKHYEEAEQAYHQAIALDSKEAKTWNNLGNLLQNDLKRYEEAEHAYRQAIVLGSENATAWYGLGFLFHYHLKRYEEAEHAYRQAIVFDSEDANPWHSLGILSHSHLKRYEEAEQAYRQAVAIDSKMIGAWGNLGNLLQNHLKHYKEAEQAYRQAIALDSKDAKAWNNLGNLLQKHLKQYEEAEQAYRQAIALEPKDANPWNGLGRLLQDHFKHYNEAEQAYRRSIALDPEDANPWSNLGDLLQNHLKRFEEAEQAYRQAIALDSDYANPWNGLGYLLQNYLNRYEQAELAFRKCIELDKDNAVAYVNLARGLLRQQKNTKEVASLYRNAIEKSPEDEFQLFLQAHLYLDNRDLAAQALNALAEKASSDNDLAFYQIKWQCAVCSQISLGTQLADVMLKSPYATFLQPFILALQSATGDDNGLLAAPVEIADMAKDVLLTINTMKD